MYLSRGGFRAHMAPPMLLNKATYKARCRTLLLISTRWMLELVHTMVMSEVLPSKLLLVLLPKVPPQDPRKPALARTLHVCRCNMLSWPLGLSLREGG